MKRRILLGWVLVGMGAALVPVGADAQGRGRGTRGIPPGHLPPPGECRVWHDDRPPGHQPPPTSCGEARRDAYRTGGRVIHGGGEGRDDRYDRGGRDRDGGWERECDRRDRDEDECGWGDRDGDRYPRDARYPATLPEMVWGVIFGRGDRRLTGGLREWIGDGAVRVRYVDADRNGRPEAVSWLDHRGDTVQHWIDTTGDGRADRVTVYEDGRVARVIQ